VLLPAGGRLAQDQISEIEPTLDAVKRALEVP
jgi:hypothetical protein